MKRHLILLLLLITSINNQAQTKIWGVQTSSCAVKSPQNLNLLVFSANPDGSDFNSSYIQVAGITIDCPERKSNLIHDTYSNDIYFTLGDYLDDELNHILKLDPETETIENVYDFPQSKVAIGKIFQHTNGKIFGFSHERFAYSNTYLWVYDPSIPNSVIFTDFEYLNVNSGSNVENSLTQGENGLIYFLEREDNNSPINLLSIDPNNYTIDTVQTLPFTFDNHSELFNTKEGKIMFVSDNDLMEYDCINDQFNLKFSSPNQDLPSCLVEGIDNDFYGTINNGRYVVRINLTSQTLDQIYDSHDIPINFLSDNPYFKFLDLAWTGTKDGGLIGRIQIWTDPENPVALSKLVFLQNEPNGYFQITNSYPFPYGDANWGNDQIEICLNDTLEYKLAMLYGDSIYLENGYQTNSGDYFDLTQNECGKERLIITHLFTGESITHTDTSICEGEFVFFNGDTCTETGTYIKVMSGSNGDSLLVLDLQVLASYEQNLSLYLCGDTVLNYDGNTYTEGSYILTHITQFGCDSIINLEVIDRRYEPTISLQDSYTFDPVTQVQPNRDYTLIGGSILENWYRYWTISPSTYNLTNYANNYNVNNIVFIDTCVYTIKLCSDNECGSQCNTITINSSLSLEDIPLSKYMLHPNPATDQIILSELEPNSQIEIFNTLGNLLNHFENEGSTLKINLLDLPTGTYIIRIRNDKGIASERIEVVR